jgi:hypothetical protein
MAVSLPAYVSRRISGQASVDIINRHGWDALGVDEYEKAIDLLEPALHCEGDTATLHYNYDNQEYTLSYDWKDFE